METNLNISSKLQNIISSSDLIRSGSPHVYQLRTKKDEFGSLTRITVGEKDETKTNKTILLVGETGAGKSTLINALVNYSMGVKWEDGVYFQIIEENEKEKDKNLSENQTESQTSDVMVYQIFGFEGKTLPYSLTIIDTPGFGDTRGIKRDFIINERLLDLFRSEDGVHEINAVGLVLKGSDNRVHDRLSYVFNSVTSLFEKNMEEIIVALITHSDGRRPRNVLQALQKSKIKCAQVEKDQPVYFLFNNCQYEDRKGVEDEKLLKHADEISEKGMKQFRSFLETSEPHKLGKAVEVLKERIRLAACIQKLQDRIGETEKKQTEITQIQGVLKYQNLTVEIDEVYKGVEHIDGGMWGPFYQGAVTCTVCEENCHYPGCTMSWKPSHCEVMKDGRCTVCTNKCPASDHVKEKSRYVTKTRRVQKTLREVKEMYEENKSEGDKEKRVLENLEGEMKRLTENKSQLLDEAYQHVISLEKIALNVSVPTYVHLDFLIEKMKETGDGEKIQKLEEMKWRVDEGTRSALRYMWRRLKTAE